jgi:hypothetical protein
MCPNLIVAHDQLSPLLHFAVVVVGVTPPLVRNYTLRDHLGKRILKYVTATRAAESVERHPYRSKPTPRPS